MLILKKYDFCHLTMQNISIKNNTKKKKIFEIFVLQIFSVNSQQNLFYKIKELLKFN